MSEIDLSLRMHEEADDGVRLGRWNEDVALTIHLWADEVTDFINQISALETFKQSVDAALNQGDGTYRP